MCSARWAPAWAATFAIVLGWAAAVQAQKPRASRLGTAPTITADLGWRIAGDTGGADRFRGTLGAGWALCLRRALGSETAMLAAGLDVELIDPRPPADSVQTDFVPLVRFGWADQRRWSSPWHVPDVAVYVPVGYRLPLQDRRPDGLRTGLGIVAPALTASTAFVPSRLELLVDIDLPSGRQRWLVRIGYGL